MSVYRDACIHFTRIRRRHNERRTTEVPGAVGFPHDRQRSSTLGRLELGRHVRGDDEHLSTIQNLADLSDAINDTLQATLQLIPLSDPAASARLTTALDVVLIPRVSRTLEVAHELHADDREANERLDTIGIVYGGFLRQYRRGDYDSARDGSGTRSALANQSVLAAATFNEATGLVDAMRVAESRLAAAAKQDGDRAYRVTRAMLLASVLLSLICGITVVIFLARNLVPRIRTYSHFATEIAGGQFPGVISVEGADELADLGRALNEMLANEALLNVKEERQAEFVSTIQLTASEEEAHELLRHHIERSIPASQVIVLKSNNSSSRLEAASDVAGGDRLHTNLVGAEPRHCLSMRFSRTHVEGSARPPLLSCALCGDRDTASTCEPLLVSGEVIGSVLVSHPSALDADGAHRIKESVAQAAPVLANLRNLALAEFRANNDSLTGLPNKRATDDTVKRVVAQAIRSTAPLTALMLDLDHFKEVNDRFGHGSGDDVLAAVGTALDGCLRASDFAGRYGGEEFLILLPETSIENAEIVAETIRRAVASITVPGVDREFTASIGMAELWDQVGTAASLLRAADRALYAAKAAGRNCVIAAPSHTDAAPALDEIDVAGA